MPDRIAKDNSMMVLGRYDGVSGGMLSTVCDQLVFCVFTGLVVFLQSKLIFIDFV